MSGNPGGFWAAFEGLKEQLTFIGLVIAHFSMYLGCPWRSPRPSPAAAPR
ncbi:hypothetical protein STVIR_6556 [Streptomyces viridochromogenes Tue57]|uniref:Uncharacterized protein n=1 Tax=Streptomyces viridochromogenes Tue57 TaxID=1160705 RepID=L8P7T8_STRVR|nr:hypothetical protein [Streptomyces viridochromogenes]ELS52495.1 hypothetical protein STVIR_6556 [Streptomyces viridochromogenes Tue57]